MKQFTRAAVSAALCAALSLACTLPAYAAEGEMLEVNEDISVSADYDWTRFANDHLTLNVYNWGLYISDGSDDSVNVVSAFEDLTGIKVNYTTFDSNESLYAKMKSGGASYDVIVPSDYMVGKMIAENMLAELDYDNIPNMANIGENYLGWSYDPDNTYSVPYTWGTTGIIYNTTMVEEPPTSWADLWDVEYAGNVLMFNNSRDAYAIAAKKMGLSLNPSSVEEVDDVMKELQAQKSVVQAYVMDQIFDKLERGEAWAAPYYAGDYLTMVEENPDLAFSFPDEGFNIFIDAMCIPTCAKERKPPRPSSTSSATRKFVGRTWISWAIPQRRPPPRSSWTRRWLPAALHTPARRPWLPEPPSLICRRKPPGSWRSCSWKSGTDKKRI